MFLASFENMINPFYLVKEHKLITSSSSIVFIDPRVCMRRNSTSKFLGRKSNNVGELSLVGTNCVDPGKSWSPSFFLREVLNDKYII